MIYKDKHGVEIKAGDTLYNAFDEIETYKVLTDGKMLFLGDFDSPLARYSPEKWWEIVQSNAKINQRETAKEA